MKLLSASAHYLDLPTGERIKYLRLMYRAGRAIIGRSVLARRFPPEFVARVEASEATHAVADE